MAARAAGLQCGTYHFLMLHFGAIYNMGYTHTKTRNAVFSPLRKTRPEGTTYTRRDAVTAEIHALSLIGAAELEARAAVWTSCSPGYISPEALLYFVRNTADEAQRNKLTELLLNRVSRQARPTSAGSTRSSLTQMNIQEDVVDHFIDLVLADRKEYVVGLDYYEVNFNGAIASDRLDASRRHWKHENRTEELGTEDAEVSEHVEAAVGSADPFDPEELDKKVYRLLLDDAIDSLPELQRRIVVMWREEIPIESSDPSVRSISEVLGKTPKTIAKYRDIAFESLRRRLERKERV